MFPALRELRVSLDDMSRVDDVVRCAPAGSGVTGYSFSPADVLQDGMKAMGPATVDDYSSKQTDRPFDRNSYENDGHNAT